MLRGCLPQFFASTSCSSDAESFNQFPASASTGFFRNSHQCTSRVVYCLNLLELEHFVFEFCFGNTGIGFFIWKNKNYATNISEEPQIEQLSLVVSPSKRPEVRADHIVSLNWIQTNKPKANQDSSIQNITKYFCAQQTGSCRTRAPSRCPSHTTILLAHSPLGIEFVLLCLNMSSNFMKCH